MRVYSASDEETLRARKLIADWAGEGFLTKEQYQHLEQDTVSGLRTTDIFLRLILFLFTLISVCAAVGLFYQVFFPHSLEQTSGVFLLIWAAISYAAAELAASRARLYRFGIEEALAVGSVGFLCIGMQIALFSGYRVLPPSDAAHSLVPAAGTVASLWIWRRFGLWYAFPAAMIFAVALSGYWTSSDAAHRAMIAAFFVVGLLGVAALRTRHRFDYLEDAYSLVEAFLWLGIYLAINLKLSPSNLPTEWWTWTGSASSVTEYTASFYWSTWVLTWCLPPVILARGIREKDRFVIAVGTIAAVLTFVSNKPYLGLPRHTWDPMLLGIMLTGVAWFIRRWLAQGAGGVRGGFTAARLSGRDKQWMSAASAVLGLVTPQSITPKPQATSEGVHFGGGVSGGGGAGGDF